MAGEGIRRSEDKSVDDCKLTGEIPSVGLQNPTFNHCHNNIGYSMGLKKLSSKGQFFVDA